MRTQKHPIGNDFNAAVMQENLRDLFEAAHNHSVKGSLPSASDGAPGDLCTVDDGTTVYFCVRTSRGWFRTSALTAI